MITVQVSVSCACMGIIYISKFYCMETLVNLTSYLRKRKVKSFVKTAERIFNGKSKMGLFYQALLDDREDVCTETLAKKMDFPDSNDAGFRNVKKDLKNWLVNLVFVVDPKDVKYGDLESAYFYCWREWAAAKVLLLKGATVAGMELAQKVFKRAERYQFTELAMHASRTLRMHYATRAADQRRYKLYDKHFNYYFNLFNWENQAENSYTSLMIHYSASRSSKPDISKEAFACFAALKPALKEYRSHRLHRFILFIELMGHMAKHDYPRAVQVCDKALQELSTYQHISKQGLSSFIYQKLVCHTKLREFDKGWEVVQTGLDIETPGSFNWFKNRELSIILAFHSKAYNKAYQIYKEASNHPNFKKLEPVSAEMWKIINGYIQYLKFTERIQYGKGEKAPKRFRLGKFLNEVPTFSRDKRGMNIAIIVLQILFTIGRHNYNKSIDSIEALESYCTRYLRRDDTFRSNCFIKMLLQIPIYGFQRRYVEHNAQKHADRLQSLPLAEAPQGVDIELIPYEDLWPMVLDSLGKRAYWHGDWRNRRYH